MAEARGGEVDFARHPGRYEISRRTSERSSCGETHSRRHMMMKNACWLATACATDALLLQLTFAQNPRPMAPGRVVPAPPVTSNPAPPVTVNPAPPITPNPE